MSLFTQTTAQLESVAAEWAALSDSVDEQIEVLADLHQQQQADEDIDGEVLSGLAESACPLSAQLSALETRLAPVLAGLSKFAQKAAEGRADPEKALYGAGMLAKIDAASARAQELQQSFRPRREHFDALHSKLQQKLAEATARAETQAREQQARQAEAAAKLAAEQEEAARVHAELEKAAAAAAALQAQKDAEAAAAAKVEAARLAKEEADARASAAAAAREQLLAERRAQEAAEALAAEQQRVQREAATSAKPLQQRSAEQLAAALAELKASCTPPALTVRPTQSTINRAQI